MYKIIYRHNQGKSRRDYELYSYEYPNVFQMFNESVVPIYYNDDVIMYFRDFNIPWETVVIPVDGV